MKKTPSHITAALTAALLATTSTYAATRTVTGGGLALQNTIDISVAGDVLEVGPGTYDPISTAGKAITIRSTGGPSVTLIDGNGTTRCATLATAGGYYNTVLSGFTLTNGYDAVMGGGAYFGTLTNCVLSGNSALDGGGACASLLTDCRLSGNSAIVGGGAFEGELYNCILSGNTATSSGGGMCNSQLEGCTLSGNTASNGGGAYEGDLYNCTLSDNTAINFGGGACSRLYGCTLSGNAARCGGGAYNSYLEDCTLTGNEAKPLSSGTFVGGGACSSELYGCILTGNSAPTAGGGADHCDLYNCTLSGNSAGIYSGGAHVSTLYNCTLTGNTVSNAGNGSVYGGGASSSTLYNCTLTGNTASIGGNGTANGGGAYTSTLYGCLLTDNKADDGGGVWGGILYNCLLSGNTASDGGGVYSGTLYNCTVSLNTATGSGGGGGSGGTTGGTLYNCIVWGNTATYNTSYDNYKGGTFAYSCTAPLPSGTGNIDQDPMFVDAANGDFRLHKKSPCVDTGNDATVTWALDLGGNPRIQGYRVDMGACESSFFSPRPYLSDPAEGPADYPCQTTAYDGFIYDTANTICGTLSLNAKMAEKKDKKTGITTTNWTFSAKAVLQAATVSFSVKTNGVVERFAASTKNNAETLDVRLEGGRFYGTLSGIKAGGKTLSVDGARAAFANKKDVVAVAELTPLLGLYNVALLDRGAVAAPKGYVSLSVAAAGAVKYAGQLSDGTKVSGAAKLIKGLNEDGWYAIALYKPLYSKKGFVGGLLWLDANDPTPNKRVIRVDTFYDWSVVWSFGLDKLELDVQGGYFGNGKDAPDVPAGLFFSANVPSVLPLLVAGGAWREAWYPTGLELTPKGAGNGLKLELPKGQLLNPSGATLSYTAKTGIFKGAFKLYCGAPGVKDKAASATYAGIMVPDGDGLIGFGTGSAKINKDKIWLDVEIGK